MGEVVPFKRRGSWFAGALLLAAVGGAGVATLDMSKVADAAVEFSNSTIKAGKQILPKPAPKPVKVIAGGALSQGMARCAGAIRITCVVDGDTFWWKREKIRIENIDAPEMTGRCKDEPSKAERAAKRLTQLLDGDVRLIRYGKDKYGRTLARVVVDGDDIGYRMVSEGLARAWPEGPKTWCSV